MWVIIVLLLIGGTIVCVRLFRNGALEEAELEARESPAPESLEPPALVKTPTRATRARPAAGVTATAPAPAAAWPGGDCPSCGSPTVPSAKFCGECGHRLTH